jgi:HK97 family phage prohead protease
MTTVFEQRNLPTTADEMRALEARELVTPGAAPAVFERRAVDLTEVRSSTTDAGTRVGGRCVVFDSPSVDMGGWYEVVARGALSEVLAANPDVRLLFNHDGLPLGRTTAGTLELREEPDGIDWDALLPDTSLGRDIAVLLDRGDLSQMSYRFRVAPGGSTWTIDGDGRERRTITKFGAFPETSIVTFPAFTATSAERRSAERTDRAGGPAGPTAPDGGPEQRDADPGAADRWRARTAFYGAVLNNHPQEGTHA